MASNIVIEPGGREAGLRGNSARPLVYQNRREPASHISKKEGSYPCTASYYHGRGGGGAATPQRRTRVVCRRKQNRRKANKIKSKQSKAKAEQSKARQSKSEKQKREAKQSRSRSERKSGARTLSRAVFGHNVRSNDVLLQLWTRPTFLRGEKSNQNQINKTTGWLVVQLKAL